MCEVAFSLLTAFVRAKCQHCELIQLLAEMSFLIVPPTAIDNAVTDRNDRNHVIHFAIELKLLFILPPEFPLYLSLGKFE